MATGKPGAPPDGHDDLSRYWNALNAGEPAPRGELDPDLAATVRYLRAVGESVRPDPAFLARLGDRLMDTTMPAPFSMNGFHANASHAEPLPLPGIRLASRSRRFARGVGRFTQAAAAVLLVLFVSGALALYADLVPNRTGSDTGWSMFRGGPARTGAMAGPGIAQAPGLLWSVVSDAPEHPAFAIADGTIYLSGDEQELYALNAVTGEVRWRAPIAGTAGVVPAVADGTVFAGTKQGLLVALDAKTGAERWRFDAGAAIESSPAVVDGTLYVGTAGGTFYALDAATSAGRWRVQLDGVTWSSPAVADGTVFAGDDKHKLHAFDAATGAEKWTFTTRGSGVVPAPMVDRGTVYVATWGGALFAIDEATGAQRWMFVADGTVGSPTLAGDLIAVGSDDGNVYAIDRATGAERWRFATKDRVFAQPLAVDGALYVGSFDGRIYALEAATGSERWRVGLAPVAYGPVLADGRLYLVSADGRLSALAADAATTPLSETPMNSQAICGCSTKEPWLR